MTEAIYLEITETAEAARKAKRRVSVSGMLKYLAFPVLVIMHGSSMFLLTPKSVAKP